MARRQSRAPTSDTRGPDSILKNAASSFVAQMTTASLTAVLTLFLVRALGPTQYGLFAVAIGVSTIAIALADFGISTSTSRFVAEHRGRDPELPALIADALKVKVVITGVACALLAALASVIAGAYGDPQLVWPLRGIALATFGQSTFLMLCYVTTSLGRAAVNVRLVAVESVLEISASIALVLAGAGATGAAFGRAIGYVFGAVIAAGIVLRLSGHPVAGFWRLPRGSTIRRVGRYARFTFAIDASYTLSASLSVVLLGLYAGATASGIFQAPAKLIVLIQYVGLSAANGVAPRLARGPGQKPDVDAMARALRALVLFQCLMLAPALVWATPITHLLLGRRYSQSADVLRALVPYIFFCGLAPLVTNGVTYMGEAARRVPIALATLALVATGGVILIPSHGAVGAAISADVAFAFYTLAHVWLCRRLLQLRIRRLLWSLACGLTAAAAMGLVLWSVGTKHLTISDWLIGGLGGLAIYIAVLRVTHQIRGRDIARAVATISARLRRPQPEPGTRRSPEPIVPPLRGETDSTATAVEASPAARSEPRIRDRLGATAGAASRALEAVLGSRRIRSMSARAQAPTRPRFVTIHVRGSRSPAATPPAWVDWDGPDPGEFVEASVPQGSPAAAPARSLASSTAEPERRSAARNPVPTDTFSAAVRRRFSSSQRWRWSSSHPASRHDPSHPPARSQLSVAATESGAAPGTMVTSGSRMDAIYQIAWRPQDETGVFELRPVELLDSGDTGSGLSVSMWQSPPVPWRWRIPPAPLPEARRAHTALVNQLLVTGWRRAGTGDGWFAHRFQPPTLKLRTSHSRT